MEPVASRPTPALRGAVRARRLYELVPTVLFGLFVAGMAGFLLYQGRDTTFFFDEWSVWSGRHGAAPSKWLGEINGHLSAVPILIFTAITATFGAEDLLPYRIAVVVAHSSLLALVWMAARPRIGAWMSLVVLLPVGVVGSGWLVLLMPFTGLFAILPLIGAVAAYVLLRRGTRGGDVGASLALLGGLASGGLGVAVIAAAMLAMLLDPALRRRSWVAAGPLVLYLIWRQWQDVASEVEFWDFALVPTYTMRGLASGLTGYTNFDAAWAQAFAVAFVALAVWSAVRTLPRPSVLVGAVATAVGYWALIAIARGPEVGPEEVRYVYGNAFLALLIGLGVAPRVWPRLAVFLPVAAAAAMVLISQMDVYLEKAANYRENSQFTQADIFAIRTLQDVVPPEFTPPEGDPQLSAEAYLTARRFWSGPPGLTEVDVLAGSPELRDHLDTVLVKAAGLSVAPATEGLARGPWPLDRPTSVDGARMSRAAECWRMAPAEGAEAASADILVPTDVATTVVVRATDAEAQVAAGRYFDQPIEPLGAVAAGTAGAVAVPADTARTPWRLRVSSAAAVRLCAAERA